MAKKRYQLRTRKFNFRLDPNDPREKEVIEVFQSLVDDETGIREIVTEAVLSFKGKKVQNTSPERVMLRQMRGTLSEFQSLLKEARDFYAIQPENITPEYQQQENQIRHRLSGAVQSMISPAKTYDED